MSCFFFSRLNTTERRPNNEICKGKEENECKKEKEKEENIKRMRKEMLSDEKTKTKKKRNACLFKLRVRLPPGGKV